MANYDDLIGTRVVHDVLGTAGETDGHENVISGTAADPLVVCATDPQHHLYLDSVYDPASGEITGKRETGSGFRIFPVTVGGKKGVVCVVEDPGSWTADDTPPPAPPAAAAGRRRGR